MNADKTKEVKELINKLRRLDVLISVEDGDLDIEAPEHALTDELLSEIKAAKQDLVAFLVSYQGRQNDEHLIAALPEAPSYMLSSPQRRIWILSQFEAINIAYNMPGVYEFTGALDRNIFGAAFAAVVERHETLRTVFKQNKQQEVYQFIKTSNELGFEITYTDLQRTDNQDSLLSEALNALVVMPFDLVNGPMLRAGLFQLDPERYIFFFNMHHIIGDGWSMGVLIHDVVVCYNAMIKGEIPDLAPLRIQYKDYAAWQWKELTGAGMDVHRAYWLDQFKGDIPVLDLPIANTRPALKTSHGSMVHGRLNGVVVSKLKDMIRPEGGTLFMGLLAGVKALLHRYSGQEDIVIGSPVAGRENSELDNQIGFYINTLALRTRFKGAEDFKTLYRNVKDVTLAGFKHQMYPFDDLVDELKLKRDLSRSALFDVMVAIQNNEEEARSFKLGDVTINQYPTNHVTSKFDLIFNFTEVKDELHYTIEYNTDLYYEESIHRMREHFENLMAFVVVQPQVPVNKIDFLTVEEKKAWATYNKTAVSYPTGKNLVDLFTEQADKTPDGIALVFDDISFTYRQLYAKANQLANYLLSLGEQLNKPIPIVAGKSPEQIWGVLGVLIAGAHYIPVKGDLPEARINELLLQSGAAFALVQPSLIDKVDTAADVQIILLTEETIKQQSVTCDALRAAETDLAYIIFTSGSTGKPKGVMIDHRGAVNTLYDINARFGVTSADIVFGISDLSFDLSVYDIFGTFAVGATLVLPKDSEVQDSDAWLNYVAKHQITLWNSVPQLVNLLVAAQQEREEQLMASLRLYFMSGDWIPVDLPERIRAVTPNATVISMGGATEGSIWSIYYPIVDVDPQWKSIPYGYPLGNQEMYVLNDALEPSPFGVPGGVFIGGRGVAKGYYGDEQKTAHSFLTHPVLKTPLYRTGDFGVFHPDGYINFLGRQDGQVKIRGYRIEMGEIESTLNGHPQVEQCVVATTPPEGKDRELVAYVVSNEPINTAVLSDYLGARLPQYMIPSYFVQLEQLPLTANGKVDKKALPDPMQERHSAERTYLAPSNEIEQQLAKIWSSILRIDAYQISADDNFFELGGHSLKVTQLKSMISQAFGIKFKINELFIHTCIADQARFVASSETIAESRIPKIETADYYLLSSSQRRLWVLSQFEETNIAYNIPLAYSVEGTLHLDILESVLKEVVARHEILRTVFNTQADGEVYQIVQDATAVDCSIRFSDLQFVPDRDEILQGELKQAAQQPFDLANGPLFSVSVYKMEEERQVLFICMHHIIGDGWSLEVLLKELLLLYNARINGTAVTLDSLALQYKDYAHWQRAQLQGDQLEKHKSYWLEQFAGELPVLELPAAYKRPSVQTHHGAVVNGRIAAKTARAFKTLVQSQHATLFMGLLAAVKTLCYRYTGNEDIVIGSPVAGREHADLSNQIGLYIGMLALRTRFSSEQGFDRLLQQVKEVALGAYEHQVYPFDELVAALDPKRDTSRSALFDVVMILHNNTKLSESIAASGISMQPYEFEQSTSKFDITFNFAEVGEMLEYAIEYNTDIYSEAQMIRMANHLEHLLQSISNDDTIPLRKIKYLSDKEQEMLVHGFNNTTYHLDTEETLLRRFSEQVAKYRDATAVIFKNKTLTYGELQKTSDEFAAQLILQGVQKGDLVGVFLERSEQMMVALLAILKAGAAYVPLDPAYPKDRISFVINDAGIITIVTQGKLTYKLPAFAGQLIDMDVASKERKVVPFVDVKSEDLAYVIYTSGSTGQPKGVLVTHGNVANFLCGMDREIQHAPGDTLLAVTTISFDISVLELFWTLANGMKVVIQPTQYLSATAAHAARKMDFSLFYFASEVNEQDKYRLLLEGAKFADKNGFSAIWTPERHFHEFGGIYPNPAITGAAIATITDRIQIRSGSCVLPLHNPIRVAEEWSVVDNLSNGRIGLSFASGWVMNDFLAFALDRYEDRYQLLYDGIDQVKSLWKGDSINLSNPNGADATVEIFPKPIQKELPVWITAAGSPETFRMAGAKGANMLTHLLGQTIEELKEKIAIYRAARKDAGHIGEGHVTLMIHTFIGEDLALVKEKVHKPFRDYLSNSVGLLRSLGKSIGQDVDDKGFKQEDMEALLDHAFDRYFETAALFGTPETCLEMVHKLSQVGVDEIGCLVDFGLDFDTAFGGLQYLNTVREQYEAQTDVSFEEHSMAAMIWQYQATHLQCTPSALKMLLQEEDVAQQLASLQQLMVGGEALPQSLADEVHDVLNVTLHNMYGPTETTVWSATAIIEKGANGITIGKPIANTQIYILDQNLNVLPVGVTGEIYIGGAGVTKGYLNRPELTAERFIPNPYRRDDLLYRTGDRGLWNNDGTIACFGRSDDQVKVRGHRIEPGEIEAVLRQSETITDAVVTTFLSKNNDWELVAYIVGADEFNVSKLRNLLAKQLPSYMIPTHFVRLNSLPLTPNGKIDKKALPTPQGLGIATGTTYVAPRNKDEDRLAEAWSELLEKDKATIGIHDNFFELGGQSLSAIRLMGIISKELNMKIPLSLIFENPTIYEFMGWLNIYQDTLRTEQSGETVEIEEIL